MVEALQGVIPRDRNAQLSGDQASVVTTIFGGSEALGNLLIKHPDWLQVLDPEKLKFARRNQGMRGEVECWLAPMLQALDFSAALNRLREFKQRELLRIAARDLLRLDQATGITQELSDVADVCLAAVWRACYRQMTERHGHPWGQDANGRWIPVTACMLGMGKLGGQELNYSSDVDVLFVYSDEGGTFRQPPSRHQKAVLSNHQFFNRLAEAFIAELGKLTDAGTLYRIDLRLRPEGESGPLSRSLASYENYYAQWGQTWERMMLIKARGVAGDAGLAAEFLETVQPFRYPRSISEGVLTEVGALKDRIEREVVGIEAIESNVKLGRGGIREIEFVAQALQLLHAGRQPFLQGAQTLPALQKLAQYELLTSTEARALSQAYLFLRDVEHRLQMESNLQTHTIPANRPAQERLARLMGFPTLKQFSVAHRKHRNNVGVIFDKVLRAPGKPVKTSQLPRQFEGAEAAWKQILSRLRFRDTEKAWRMLREFVDGPGYVHVSPRTRELALELLPRLFSPKHALSDPDRVVTRLDSFIAAYGARATMFELWNSNPAIFDLLVQLFDRSEFLAELAIRTPDLVDELVTSGRIRQRKNAAETLADLRHGLVDKDQHLWLRRYHQAELMRIGLRDILGLADEDQYLTELSALADACLQYALQVVMRQNKLRSPPFCIIGLGKLGGAEIDYGSDLDIIFVAAGKPKDLAKLSRSAVQVMDLVSKRTEQGTTFQTDARLRPDGEKGLLVNSLDAYEEYYLQRAMLWELQALTRTRAIAGDSVVGQNFQSMAARLTDFSAMKEARAASALTLPHAYTPKWKQAIHDMRLRIEKERTPAGKDELAIKTGSGGLMDAEFIAQALCLENGWQEPNTLRALDRARAAELLPQAKSLIENYRKLRRVEGILRRWSYEGETVLPDDPAPYYRVAVRCGFETSEAFQKFLVNCRKQIRKAYSAFINPLANPLEKIRP
jgi:[glutamine synthetase] adenylyltransferase / [glutamine synthetase]-adenylyl-L-tyrosine phosphorylase